MKDERGNGIKLHNEDTTVSLNPQLLVYFHFQPTSRDGKQICVSGLNIGLPVAYLVLKNWHKKYTNP